jgi:apolipoprotein N-acyltransferase
VTVWRVVTDHLKAQRGFLGFALAAILGSLGVLGHAPFHIVPAFAVSVLGLVIMLDGATQRPKPRLSGFAVAWSWAFGYFLAGMFWVGNAFLVDADKFALLMPFAVTALPAGLALFWGVAGIAYGWLAPKVAPKVGHSRIGAIFLFALLFSLAEFARGHLLTGLPWNLPAYIWKPGGVISQTAALIGPYGLSAVTLLLFAAPICLVDERLARRAKLVLLTSFAVLVVGMAGFGIVRLNQAGPIDPMAGNGPIISAGQGGFSQKEVWDPANAMRVTQTYVDLLDNPKAKHADIVVWPEGAFPFLLLEQNDVLQAIAERLGPRTLVVGTVHREPSAAGDTYYNGIATFDGRRGGLGLGEIYNKHHLVPFGEYLPFRAIFQAFGIASLVAYDGEMTPGVAPGLMPISGAPLADPRVCYEIIFPNFNPAARDKAGWILNVSIDAWYGDLLGPDQHYAQARYRAIETGMPLVRAASGGWSAVVDRYGRPVAEHRFGAGYATARLPADATATLYNWLGEALFAIILVFYLIALVVLHQKGVDNSKRLAEGVSKNRETPHVE